MDCMGDSAGRPQHPPNSVRSWRGCAMEGGEKPRKDGHSGSAEVKEDPTRIRSYGLKEFLCMYK